jgi:phosphatidylserine decarboxylase
VKNAECSVNSKIFIYDREKKVVKEEVIPERGLTHLLYETRLGRSFTSLFLTRRSLSKRYGRWQNSPRSAKKIKSFIDKCGINVDEIDIPPGGFLSFNDFFTRKLKSGSRPLHGDSESLISPADSRLLAYTITEETVYPVKGVYFSLEELVRDRSITKPYRGGTCLIFRLAPMDYHRFCYLDDGNHGPVQSIGGKLHSVNPLALRRNLRVFQENYREYCILSTKNFGEVIQVEVGALLVGKIHQHMRHGGSFSRGQEKGYFEFGGSTIIVILRPRIGSIDADIREYSSRGIETLVKFGSPIGKKVLSPQRSS